MKRILGDISEIQSGYSFRARLESSDAGVLVLQMRDLTDNDLVSVENMKRVSVNESKSANILQEGDLVFRSRGFDMSAALLNFQPDEPILLAAPLYRLRVKPGHEVLPRYLHWFLNQREAQMHILSRAKGTAQKMISKNSLSMLSVDVPSYDEQVRIVELAELLERERSLVTKISNKREKLISHQLIQLAKGGE